MIHFFLAAFLVGRTATATIRLRPTLYGCTNVLCGIDSETSGAGGTNYVDGVAGRLRNELGDGGPGWVPFQQGTAVLHTSGQYVGNGAAGDPVTSSGPLIPSGVFWNSAGTGDYAKHNVNRAWDYATVVFLVQPGGGNFYVRHSGNLSSPPVITDGPSGLGTVTVHANRSSGISEIDVLGVRGKVTVFGVLYRLRGGGAQVSLAGHGGVKLSSLAYMDSGFRAQWFALLQPSLVILNAGINDRDTVDPTTFGTVLSTVVSDIIAGSPSTQILLVEPLETFDYLKTNLPGYRAQILNTVSQFPSNCSFYSDRDTLGHFSQANADGLMVDGLHPSADGNVIRSRAILENLGISPVGQVAPVGKF